MKKTSFLIILALLAAVLLIGCNDPAETEDTTPQGIEDSTPEETPKDTLPITNPDPSGTGDDIGTVPHEWN